MHNLSVTACSFKFRKKNKKRIDVIQNLNDSFIYKEGSNIEKIFSSAEDIFIDFLKLLMIIKMIVKTRNYFLVV